MLSPSRNSSVIDVVQYSFPAQCMLYIVFGIVRELKYKQSLVLCSILINHRWLLK